MTPCLHHSCFIVIILGRRSRLKTSSGGVAGVARVNSQILGVTALAFQVIGSLISNFDLRTKPEAHLPRRN